DVDPHAARAGAARGRLGGDGLGGGRVEVGAGQRGAEVGEPVDRGAADAGGRADDERVLAREVEEVAVVRGHARPSLPAASAVTASTRLATTARLSRQNWGSSTSMPKPLARSETEAMPVEDSSSSYRRLNPSPSAW